MGNPDGGFAAWCSCWNDCAVGDAVTEANFTNGPWRIHIEREAGIGRTSACFINSSGSWPEGQICRVNTQDGLREMEANAHLIAAAPDMYEALETAERMMWALGACDSIGHNIIKSALSKARGEQ